MLRGAYLKETVLGPDGKRKPVGRSWYFQAIAKSEAECMIAVAHQARLSLNAPVIVGYP